MLHKARRKNGNPHALHDSAFVYLHASMCVPFWKPIQLTPHFSSAAAGDAVQLPAAHHAHGCSTPPSPHPIHMGAAQSRALSRLSPCSGTAGSAASRLLAFARMVCHTGSKSCHAGSKSCHAGPYESHGSTQPGIQGRTQPPQANSEEVGNMSKSITPAVPAPSRTAWSIDVPKLCNRALVVDMAKYVRSLQAFAIPEHTQHISSKDACNTC